MRVLLVAEDIAEILGHLMRLCPTTIFHVYYLANKMEIS